MAINIQITNHTHGDAIAQADLIQSIKAELFCIQEALTNYYPAEAQHLQFPYVDVQVLESNNEALIRVFGVDEPYELGLSVEDCIFTEVWKLHESMMCWYPDIEEEECVDFVRNHILPVLHRDLTTMSLRLTGTFEQNMLGQRRYIAYGHVTNRLDAFECMVWIQRYFAEKEDK